MFCSKLTKRACKEKKIPSGDTSLNMALKRSNSSEEYLKCCKKKCKSRNHIKITSNMIRNALKRLLLWRAFASSHVIGDYLYRHYPTQKNSKVFNEELKNALKAAVRNGLIRKQGKGYCLPTLREEAHYTYTESEKYKASSHENIRNNRGENEESDNATSNDEIDDLSD